MCYGMVDCCVMRQDKCTSPIEPYSHRLYSFFPTILNPGDKITLSPM